MTMQATDPFLWKGKEYIFLGAENVYSLFDPEAFGLKPEALASDCWKGFIISFSVKKDRLYIDRLDVNCDNNIYPEINGVKAIYKKYSGYHRYKRLNLMCPYSGTITIGKHLAKEFFGRAFLGPGHYAKTYELTFKNGIMTSYRDTSGEYTCI